MHEYELFFMNKTIYIVHTYLLSDIFGNKSAASLKIGSHFMTVQLDLR